MEAAGKYAAKKMLGDQIEKYKHKEKKGDNDPYFEMVPNKKGKLKKVKRRIPDCIPEEDAKALATAKNWAYHWDMSLFDFCGQRFGWGSVIGLIPELGDVADLVVALMIYRHIRQTSIHLGYGTHAKMLGNIGIDFLLGLVPIAGDIADAAYKCNTKNVMKLEQKLVEHYGKNIPKEVLKRQSWEPFRDDPDFQTYPSDQPPLYDEAHAPASRPAQSQRHAWREWFGSREHQQDPEMGQGRR